MSAMRTPIFIVDANGTPVEAQLCAPIGSDHVDDTENKWNPWQTAALASQANPREESAPLELAMEGAELRWTTWVSIVRN